MIEIRQLRYEHRPGHPVLRGVDADLETGCWTALVGANGSGKTTLARCLNGLLLPATGSVRVDGIEVTAASLSEIRQHVAMVFQNPDDQLVAPTVEAELAFGLENLGVEPQRMHERVEELLEAFQLRRYRQHPPHLLSGGERQRLAVASAVAVRPRHLILDEPTALLDPSARAELLDRVDRLCHDEELGILYITQNPEEAARADRILVLQAGRLVTEGSPRRVYGRGHDLTALGLDVPFAVAIADAAGGSAADALSVDELAGWLAATFAMPPGAASAPPGPPAPQPRLRAAAVEHVYRGVGLPAPVAALRGVDLDVAPGRLVGLVGASGSGKTTLVQHLNGLLRPTRGRVTLDECDIWEDGDARGARRQVGLVFQFPEDQLFAETVAEDVAFGPRNHGSSPAEAAALAADALARVGLPVETFGDREPLTLSGGERRRAAIAGVLAFDPAVVILDEPTAGLDPYNEALVADLLRDWVARGRSVILVSHDMDRVAQLATDVVVMADGRVRWHGEVRQTLRAAAAGDDALPAPLALQLGHALRSRGLDAPDLLTRDEASAWARTLRRWGTDDAQTSSPAHTQPQENADAGG